MSKKGVLSRPKHGGTHKLKHEKRQSNLDCYSDFTSQPIVSGEKHAQPNSRTDLGIVHLLSSGNNSGSGGNITQCSVANDANLSIATDKSVCRVNKGKTQIEVFESYDNSLECLKTRYKSESIHSVIQCQGQDLVSFVGTDPGDVLGMEAVVSGTDSIPQLPTMAIDSNFLNSDFPDNIKDFVFSVSDNLSKAESSSQFENPPVDGTPSSFTTLLENEDSITDNLSTVYKTDRENLRKERGLLTHVDDPTMTSTVTKVKKGLLRRNGVEIKADLETFTSLKPTSAINNTVKFDNNHQKTFQSHAIKNNHLTTLSTNLRQQSLTSKMCPPTSVAIKTSSNLSDFPDNSKDFVFSVSDNLSKAESSSQFENASIDVAPSSFITLLENEDSITDNLSTVYKTEQENLRKERGLLTHVEDPTMTSTITKERKGLLRRNGIEVKADSERFASVKPTSAVKLENCSKNIFQSHVIKNNSFTTLATSLRQPSLTSKIFPQSSVAVKASSNLSNTIDDINLNMSAVPNLLELSDGINHSPGCSDQQNEQTLDLANSSTLPVETFTSTSLLSTQAPHLSDQNLNVTTISISNQEKDSTKILVNSNQGKQNLYVINASALNGQMGTRLILSENQPMYIVKTPDVNPTSTLQANNPVISHDRISHEQLLPLQTPASNLSGFFLLPIIDSSNMVPTVQVQLNEKNDGEKPLKKLLMCPESGCMKTFKKASKLKVHKMLHTGERPYKCTLLGCEWAFTTAHKLKRHLESHEGRKDFVCDYPGCGHKFTTVYNLNSHRKLHDRPCTEVCPQEGCGIKFPTKRQLELHLRNVHNLEERTFKCPKPGCDKVFYSSWCMGSHMRVHQQTTEDRKCKFPGCGKQFSKLCRLRQHEKLHSGERPFICNYEGCTWAFATASKLKRHQTKHTGVRKWQCPICRKQYQRSEHLKGHLITHSGKKPFACPVEGCNNSFTAKSSLYVHIKRHDESGKTIVYHCPMEKCERHYANKASLRQHILLKHCSIPLKGSQPQGAINWLNLLGSGEANIDVPVAQTSVTDEGLSAQVAITPGQENIMSTDLLTGGMADQALLNSSNQVLADQTGNSIITQLMVSNGISPHSTSSTSNVAAELAISQPPQHFQQQVIPVGELLQHQERMSIEAVERGKKSQFVFENLQGSARTDCRSNDIISQRALQRWQKQKEIEAAKLRAHLEAQSNPTSSATVIASASGGDFKGSVTSFASLTDPSTMASILMPIANESGDKPAMIFKEIPDMELQAEGITTSVLEGRSSSQGDSCMTELFIKDPETGMTYRQTQLLQDDPPNPCLMEDMAEVEPSHSIILDSGLEGDLIEESLSFQDLE